MNDNEKFLYGVAYYHEYMPSERLAEDVRMMKDAGVNLVRVGESTWANWEPRDGAFATAWIDPVLDAMHAAGISVVVGTPTYALPPWLALKHPDLLVETLERRVGYGARQNMDLTHPAFLEHADRVSRFVVSHVRDHPAVVGYQVDNETKAYNTASPEATRLFVERLKTRYGTPDALNAAWNLTYWSHRITAWDELLVTRDMSNPSMMLAWRRFHHALVSGYLARQAAIVRELRRPGQFVTHNFDFEFRGPVSIGPQSQVDHFDAAVCLDVAGIDIYHRNQADFDGVMLGFAGDWTRSLLGGKRHFVLETNAQLTGTTLDQSPPWDGQFRLAALAHAAHGARMVCYWHWHSCHAGCEIYWKGILGHDLEPNRVYREMSRTAADLHALSPHLSGMSFDNPVALVHSADSLSALLDRPFSPVTDYAAWFMRMYRGLFRRSVGVDILPAERPLPLSRYKLVVAPALYSATDATLAALIDYVRTGGHLVLTFKTGFVDDQHRVRAARMPGVLREVCGFSYQEFGNHSLLPLRHSYNDAPYAHGGEFVEHLLPEGCEVLASYDDRHLAPHPAVTRHHFGAGVVTYIGCVTDPALTEAILARAAAEAGITPSPHRAPVLHRTARNAEGRTLHFLMNFSDAPAHAHLPLAHPLTDLLTGRELPPGPLTLDRWDARVLAQR